MEKRLRTFEEGDLWFCSPKCFNDLADCHFETHNLSTTLFDRRRIQLAAMELYEDNQASSLLPLSKETIRELLSDDSSEFKINKHRIRCNEEFILGLIGETISDTTAICCFSSVGPTAPLLWAHYGGNHFGFAIEYSVNREANTADELFAVNYVTNGVQVNLNELIFTPREALARIVMSKLALWSYEAEYRIVYFRKLDYSRKGVRIPRPSWLVPKRVICGPRQAEAGNDINRRMALFAKRLGVPRARLVMSRPGQLTVREI